MTLGAPLQERLDPPCAKDRNFDLKCALAANAGKEHWLRFHAAVLRSFLSRIKRAKTALRTRNNSVVDTRVRTRLRPGTLPPDLLLRAVLDGRGRFFDARHLVLGSCLKRLGRSFLAFSLQLTRALKMFLRAFALGGDEPGILLDDLVCHDDLPLGLRNFKLPTREPYPGDSPSTTPYRGDHLSAPSGMKFDQTPSSGILLVRTESSRSDNRDYVTSVRIVPFVQWVTAGLLHDCRTG